MHVTLHITTGCNMSCGYCYSPPKGKNDMSLEIARQSIDYIAEHYPPNTGIIFFGGEPLLRKDLIKETIAYSKTKSTYFHYKVTTNGLLLDADFLEYANNEGLQVSISVDGNRQAHNTFRNFPDGTHTFNILKEKIDILLSRQPYAKCLMTVTPETVAYYAESVDFLLNCGFRYVIVSLHYAGHWTDKHLQELKRQYKKIAKVYEERILRE